MCPPQWKLKVKANSKRVQNKPKNINILLKIIKCGAGHNLQHSRQKSGQSDHNYRMKNLRSAMGAPTNGKYWLRPCLPRAISNAGLVNVLRLQVHSKFSRKGSNSLQARKSREYILHTLDHIRVSSPVSASRTYSISSDSRSGLSRDLSRDLSRNPLKTTRVWIFIVFTLLGRKFHR